MSDDKKTKFIPLSVPNFSGNERAYVDEAISGTWVSTAGAMINTFEKNVALYVKAKHAVAVQSGTAGLHLAMLASNIGDGCEVIVPTLTFVAAVNPVKYAGACPVFIDCDESFCIDPDKVRDFCEKECVFTGNKLINKITEKTVKAIVAVHIFGNLCDMEKIMKIAGEYNLTVIEDATEALGSYYTTGIYEGKYAGTIGYCGVFSFNGNKIITTGGGGMIVTDDDNCAEYTKYLSTQAKDDELYFVHNEVGYNYRMTNLQAALGVAQLEQIEGFIETKRENYGRYINNAIKLAAFKEGIRPNYWFYSFYSKNRDGLIKHLAKSGIQARPVWKLIHTLQHYIDCRAGNTDCAERLYAKTVNIPCSSSLTASEVDYISEIINGYEKNI